MAQTFHHNGQNYHLPKNHYSTRLQDALFFYGGKLSNFVGGSFEIRDYDGIVYLGGYRWRSTERTREVAHSTHIREYETIEHYFQANKASTREDHDYIADIYDTWEAKRAGQKAAMDRRGVVIRPDWEDVKYEIMLAGLRVKFSEPHYRAVLINTYDRFIAEDSPTDFTWGIRDATGGYNGDNLLGKALMVIRDEIRIGNL